MAAIPQPVPSEILLEIAEWVCLRTAAAPKKTDLFSAVQVSRKFHRIFLPFLYRYIMLLGLSPLQGSFDKLISALQSKSPSFRHDSVHYITLIRYPSETDLFNLLCLCTGVKGLCVQSPRPPPRNTTLYGEALMSIFPSLTRLHVVIDWYSSRSLFGRLAESYPVNVTTLNLGIVTDENTLLTINFAEVFPALRELGMHWSMYKDSGDWHLCLSHVVETCPASVQLIFVSGVTAHEMTLFGEEVLDDPRILWATLEPGTRVTELTNTKEFLGDVTCQPCWWSRAREAAALGSRAAILSISGLRSISLPAA